MISLKELEELYPLKYQAILDHAANPRIQKSYGPDATEENIRIGRLGELVYAHFKGISADKVRLADTPDGGKDFTEKGKKIDVKTTKMTWHHTFVPIKPKIIKCDYFAVIYLENEIFTFAGYLNVTLVNPGSNHYLLKSTFEKYRIFSIE